MKKILLILFSLLLACAVGAWQGWSRYQVFLQTPLSIPAGGTVFQLEQGTSGSGIVKQLASRGLTQPGWQWRVLMRLEPHVYRAGEYLLAEGLTPQEVLNTLASARVLQYPITLVEGWTFNQFAAALADNQRLLHKLDLADEAQMSGFLSELGITHPEGWFLPETYLFTRGDSDRDILIRANRAMKAALEDAWRSRAEALPVGSPYELLILASIIEKETSLDPERPMVAGVFARRLQKGMRLQTDPTVIYGMGDRFDGNIRRRDLQTDTPYNTYTRHGLPPTPIAMPGRGSLQAAANPAPGDALYFVADGKGGHTFSATLEAHQRAVKKLIEKK